MVATIEELGLKESDLTLPKNTGSKFHASSVDRKPELTVAKQKNIELEEGYRKRLNKATDNVLRAVGEEIDRGSNKFKFIRNVVNFRNLPIGDGKQVWADFSNSEHVASLLEANIETDLKTKRFKNFICAYGERKSDDGTTHTVVEIHYGVSDHHDLNDDLEFITNITDNIRDFLEKDLNIKKEKNKDLVLDIKLYYGEDIEKNKELKNHLIEKSQEQLGSKLLKNKADSTWKDKSEILLFFEEKELPIAIKKIKKINQAIEKHKSEVGRYKKESYLEIRERNVREQLEQIFNLLPDSSNLKKLMDVDRDSFTKQVYESIKTYKGKNLEEAMGFVLEAAVAVELRQNGELANTLKIIVKAGSGINTNIHFGEDDNVVVTSEKNIYSKKEVSLDLQSSDFTDLNRTYQEMMAERWYHHGDLLITRFYRGAVEVDISERDSPGVVKKVVSILECKSSTAIKPNTDEKDQVTEEIEELQKFIDKYNKKMGKVVLTSLPKGLLNVVLVKPSISDFYYSQTDRFLNTTILNNGLISVVRSSVTDLDMKVVRAVMEPRITSASNMVYDTDI